MAFTIDKLLFYIMKKILIFLTIAFASFGFVKAQDIETIRSLYKEASELLNDGNLLISLPKYLTCLNMAQSFGDDAVDIVRGCQEVIPQIYLRCGDDAAAAGDTKTAIANFQRVIKTATEYGNNLDIVEKARSRISQLSLADLMKQGQTLAQNGDIDSAIDEYTKVVEAAGKDTEEATEALKLISNCYLRKAVLCMKNNDNRGCLENAQLAAQAMDSPNAEKLIGVSALNLEQYNVAIPAFEACLALSPNASNESQIIIQLATAYERSNDIDKACAYYQQIISDSKYGELAQKKVTEFKCNKKNRHK